MKQPSDFAILDAPTIDTSMKMVYAETNNGANTIAFQATTQGNCSAFNRKTS
jgi:hypothetical protein